jgi:hypothetical protein
LAILASEIIAYARAVTDTEITAPFPDANVLPVLNAVYQRVRRKLAVSVPQPYTKVVSFTASAATQDLLGAPLSLTDFGVLRRIRRLVSGSDYEPVGVANAANPDLIPFDQTYAVLLRGTILEFYPSTQVVGQTFEISYLSQPVALTAVGNTIDCPEDFREILGEFLASKFRFRNEESAAAHIEVANELFSDAIWILKNQYGVQPEGMNYTGTRW